MVRAEPTHSSIHQPIRRPRALVVGLSFVVLTVAVLQTAVVPVLGVIADQLNSSTVGVSWAVTANLLAAAAATPLIGRLADLHSKKHVLLVVLVVVLAGSVLAATTSSLPLLIVGRILQAASFSLYPVGVAILREELTEDRMVSAMSVLSGTLGFGGGTGLVVVGLLMNHDAELPPRLLADHRVHRRVIAIVVFSCPPARAARRVDRLARRRGPRRLDCPRVLLAITQGHSVGLDVAADARVCRRAASSCSVGWWLWERRAKQPLVSTTMLSRRPILLTNLATVFVGMGLYFAFLGLTQFVQIPREAAGYGFGATVLQASVVYLLPGARHRFPCRVGQRPVHRPLRRPTGPRSSRPPRASRASCSSPSRIRRRGRSSPPAFWPTPTSASATAHCLRWSSARSTRAKPASPRA